MSSYLMFKKGDVELVDYSRNTAMYEALGDIAPYSEWKEVKAESLEEGMASLREKKENYEKEIRKLKEILNHQAQYEDLYETLNNIEEYEENIKDVETALIELKLIYEIADYNGYYNDTDDPNAKKPVLMWSVG